MSKSVVVFGQGSLGVAILDYFTASPDYRVAAVVPSLPERSAFVSLSDRARCLAVPVMTTAELLASDNGRFDLGFSCYFNLIMREDLRAQFDLLLNLHNSPLPRYRGVLPVNWALENEERTHGVTIHEIDAGIDTGPIFSQCSFTIDPTCDEVIDVYQRCLAFGRVLFEQTIPRVWTIQPTPQDDSASSTYTRRESLLLRQRTGLSRHASDAEILANLRL